MESEDLADAIYQAKVKGMTDENIMREFSVGLREIEQAVIRKTGTNLNLFAGKTYPASLAPKKFSLESTTVWSFKSRGRWATHNGNYRGNWSPYIPRNVILRYSELGDLVLDQFSGGGTTATEAKLLGRRCIARDISPAAISLTKKNLEFDVTIQETLDDPESGFTIYDPSVDVGDARNLEGIADDSIDLICTHPPYADIVQYSNGIEGDISFHKVDEFIEDMKEVAQESLRVLRPNGFCAVLIGDMRKNKRVIPLGFRTIDTFLEQGFALKDLVIKRQHNCRTTGFWYSRSVKYNFLLLSQEYLPIFQKPLQTHQGEVTESATRPIGFRTLTTKPTSQPETMESMTTWVFQEESAQQLTDANVISRYGGANRILELTLESEFQEEIPHSNELDLVYIRANFDESCSRDCLSTGLTTLTKAVSEIESMLVESGHLVIRTTDYKRNDYTVSPALKIRGRIKEPLNIREIIVVSKEDDVSSGVSSDPSITHEYVLVYQKD